MKLEKSEMKKTNTPKKKYIKPQVKKFGTVHELTQFMSSGASTDGMGVAHMSCITPAPQIDEHRHLLIDNDSQAAFRKQIFDTVKPGDTVLDLGTGSGLHAFFACQAGAKRVYAIDTEAILEVARQAAILNGFDNQIEFILTEARDLVLPEKVDVIITNIGFLNTLQTLPLIAKKHLKAGGKLIPEALELQFCMVEAPKEYAEQIKFWEHKKFDLDFSVFRKIASNHPLYTVYEPSQMASNAGSLGVMQLEALNLDFMENEINLHCTKTTEIHGLGGWYRFWSNGDIMMSTEPPLKLVKELWSEIFLPFENPIQVKKGETYRFQIGMYSKGSYTSPIWRWKGYGPTGLIVDQCSFYSIPLTKQFLEKIEAQKTH